MKELWIKTTAFRRYLIEDKDECEVKEILKHITDESSAKKEVAFIADYFDKNDSVEYDNEVTLFPVDYHIQEEA